MLDREWAVYVAVRVRLSCARLVLMRDMFRLSYLISENVVFLVIADKSYPRKLAFSYLDELSKEFALSYGAKVDTVRKPYAFVGFGESHTRLPYSWVLTICSMQTHSWARQHGCTKIPGTSTQAVPI